MSLAAEPDFVTPIASEERKSGALVRLAAAVGGLVVLACAGVVTLGTVLIVLIGMAVVGGVQRKRGRPLTRTGHWVAACSTMAVVLLAVGGIFYAAVPRSALDAAKQSMDSSRTEAAKQPPPAWLERLSPGYRQIAQNAKPSPAAERIGTAFGFVFAISVLRDACSAR